MSESLIFGLHAVQAALASGQDGITSIYLDRQRSDRRLQALIGAAEAAGVAVCFVDRVELDRLAGGQRHQGAVAKVRAMGPRNETFLEELLTGLGEPAFLLVLDGVQDPHNLGACLRTADATGVHALIAPRDRACGLTPVARKVASGAAETVPFVQVTNLARTLRFLRETGIWVVGTALEGSEGELFDTDLRGPLALVLGAEGKGLRRLTRENCDRLVHIPMAGTVQSLNVSVAAAVSLYEALRQRRTSG